jgi:hypothetical protein
MLKAKASKGGKAGSGAGSAANSTGTAASSGSGSGVDTLTDQDGQLWFGEIEVGNPPSKFTGKSLSSLLSMHHSSYSLLLFSRLRYR